MMHCLNRTLSIAVAAVMLACGRSEPQVPRHVITEICSGGHIDSETRAQLGAASYTLLDLGPEFSSQAAPLAKAASGRGEPVVIPALPPLAEDGAIIPALAPSSTERDAAPVLIRNGGELLAINPRVPPYSVTVPKMCLGHFRGASRVKICVSDQGKVSSVEILERSVKWLDEQLPEVIGRWQFHPYSLNGKARPFCFTTKYSIDALED